MWLSNITFLDLDDFVRKVTTVRESDSLWEVSIDDRQSHTEGPYLTYQFFPRVLEAETVCLIIGTMHLQSILVKVKRKLVESLTITAHNKVLTEILGSTSYYAHFHPASCLLLPLKNDPCLVRLDVSQMNRVVKFQYTNKLSEYNEQK